MDSKVQLSPQQRLEHAEIWLRQARQDRSIVERILGRSVQPKHRHLPRNPQVAVYLLQQAVEKAVKSLMFAAGKDEDILRRRYGHNSLLVMLDFIRQRFSDEPYRQMFDSLLEYQSLGFSSADEALKATDNLIKQVNNRNLRELAALSPDAMSVMVELTDNHRKQTIALTNRLLSPKTFVTIDASNVADSSAADYIMAVATAAMRRDQLAADVEASVRKIIDPVALEWIESWRASESIRLPIIREKMLSDLILPQFWTLPALYMLAALTFPHEASSRYPAPWNAPSDPLEAARCDKMGVQHYTASLGAVVQLPALHQLTRLVLDSMRPLLVHAVESTDQGTD